MMAASKEGTFFAFEDGCFATLFEATDEDSVTACSFAFVNGVGLLSFDVLSEFSVFLKIPSDANILLLVFSLDDLD